MALSTMIVVFFGCIGAISCNPTPAETDEVDEVSVLVGEVDDMVSKAGGAAAELGLKKIRIDIGSLVLPKQDFRNMTPFRKDFNVESPTARAISEQDVLLYSTSRKITVQGCDLQRLIRSFDEANFLDSIIQAIAKCGLAEPTPIQAQGWPMTLKGRYLIDIAKNSSGKTLAYFLPALVHVTAQPQLVHSDGPVVLILAPTRELVVQIQEQAMKFGSHSHVRSTRIYGRAPKGPQICDLKRG